MKRVFKFIKNYPVLVLIIFLVLLIALNFIFSSVTKGTFLSINFSNSSISNKTSFSSSITSGDLITNIQNIFPISNIDYSADYLPIDGNKPIVIMVDINNPNGKTLFQQFLSQFTYDKTKIDIVYNIKYNILDHDDY